VLGDLDVGGRERTAHPVHRLLYRRQYLGEPAAPPQHQLAPAAAHQVQAAGREEQVAVPGEEGVHAADQLRAVRHRVGQRRAQVGDEGVEGGAEVVQRVPYRLRPIAGQVHRVVGVQVESRAVSRYHEVARPGRTGREQQRTQAGDQWRQLEEGDLAGDRVGVVDGQLGVATQVLRVLYPP